MRIEKLKLKNFCGFVGENEFKFNTGINFIIGANGTGKTTILEALRWVFDDPTKKDRNSNNEERKEKVLSYFPKKVSAEMKEGEIQEISVEVSFNHHGKKSLKKSVSIIKSSKFNNAEQIDFASLVQYTGNEDTDSERKPTDASALLTRCYPSNIQRFSMFNGEEGIRQLLGEGGRTIQGVISVETNEQAYNSFIRKTEELKNLAFETLAIKQSQDDDIEKRKNNLLKQRKTTINKKETNDKRLESIQAELNSNQRTISRLEKNKALYEDYEELNQQFEKLVDEKSNLRRQINLVSIDLNLLDKLWILKGIPPFYNKFKDKIHKLLTFKEEKEKEEQLEKGKQLVISELKTDIPGVIIGEQLLESMINDEECKVCGRKADKGTEPYNFILEKLQSLQKSKSRIPNTNENIEDNRTFKNNYLFELYGLSIFLEGREENLKEGINQIPFEIRDLNAKHEQLNQIENNLQTLRERISGLFAKHNIEEEDLLQDKDSLTDFIEDRGRLKSELKRLEDENQQFESKLKVIENDLIKQEKKSDDSEANVYESFNNYLDTISQVFNEAKDNDISEFLLKFEAKTNQFINKLNENDIHGNLKIQKSLVNSTFSYSFLDEENVQLWSSWSNPDILSTSQIVASSLSMILAAAELSSTKYDYPLIFDAPTSSFDVQKSQDFFNTVLNLDHQIIIITSEFAGDLGTLINLTKLKNDCSINKIQKAPTVDDKKISTFCVNITPIRI